MDTFHDSGGVVWVCRNDWIAILGGTKDISVWSVYDGVFCGATVGVSAECVSVFENVFHASD